jgi:hypothetical protein
VRDESYSIIDHESARQGERVGENEIYRGGRRKVSRITWLLTCCSGGLRGRVGDNLAWERKG